jgi:rhodanese-related sulfurtransferase
MENILNNFMEKGWPFIVNHWELFAALVVVLAVILVFERKAKAEGPSVLDPQSAVGWINHEQAIVIDIRDRDAFRKGHIINSESIQPANVVTAVKGEKYKDKPILIVCAQGISSAKTAALLKKEGIEKVATLKGGIQAWKSADLPLEKK